MVSDRHRFAGRRELMMVVVRCPIRLAHRLGVYPAFGGPATFELGDRGDALGVGKDG